jgi:ubiquinone biosynthesis protein COQ4
MQPAAAIPPDVSTLPAPVRWGRALRALARVMWDPRETDQVLVFSTYANGGSMTRAARFYEDASGEKLYAEDRRLDSRTVDLDALAALPAGTLGHAYATFMRAHGLTPDVFDDAPQEVHDRRTAYVIQRMRQTHDLWHVVTNCETDTAGEVALQAFTFAQVGAPSSAILAAVGTLRTRHHAPRAARDARALYRLGKRAGRLATFVWEDHWATPIGDVRRMLGLPVDPPVTGGYSQDVLAA